MRKEQQTIENNQKRYWVWLSLIRELGAIKKQKLLEHFKTAENLYNATKEELMQASGIGEKTAEIILNKNIRQGVDKHIEYMQKHNIDIISIKDQKYPKLLKEIYDPPISLYIRGNKNILNNDTVAIIGCRECTDYGRNITKKLAYDIAKNKITIISGLAKGIDAVAHKGAILAEEKTIAVLGNGLDTVYPTENIGLAKEILQKGGAIISEYPLGEKPQKQNFPERNRIVSGISKGVVVVEAKEKSGTLITVDFALEQGRDVFVVPGNIDSEESTGTNRLIKQGAKVVTSYEDIVEEYKKEQNK